MQSVMTVTGPVPATALGATLMHEHIFLDLTSDVAGRNSLLNDPELAYRELLRYREAGGVTLVDQTTGGLRGHDHDLLPVQHALAVREMARRTGLQIVLGAGWYREPYYERRLWRMKTDQIAEELVRDLTAGLDGTDVRAGLLGEIGAHFTWVSPAEERMFRAVGRAHRQTGSAVYFVFEGRGASVIDGQRFDWRTGDLFVVPTWAWHEHASADGEAILFSVQDTPVMQALGLYREQAYGEHDGHQPVTRVFG